MSIPLDTLPHESGVDLSRLIADYGRAPGTFDEMIDGNGAIRSHWLPLLTALAGLGENATRQHFATANEHLASSGVFYRVYEDHSGPPRKYTLSHIPLIISAADWLEIASGLKQRATIIESVLADAYGAGTLCSEGRLPAAVLSGSPEFLRPLHNVRPRNGRHLTFYAADIGRDVRGRWWVLRDRTQAPSGAGYALENRIALSRALGDVYASYGVERLASFFEVLRDGLTALRNPGDAGVCFLTPGPLNEAYFEHVYLSRYLGFRLVEGQDLTVLDERVYLRTVRGLREVNVMMRRVDADFTDPLELNTSSRLGIPGLVGAIRAGNVTVINALGSGVMEAPAFMSFLPALAPQLSGAELAMPNVGTWWCGQPTERRFVLDNLESLAVSAAFSSYAEQNRVQGSSLSASARARLREQVEWRGVDFVGQEPIRLSTMPYWEAGRLVPRPFMVRVYLAATDEGWKVMPGGLALVGSRPEETLLTMQRGAEAADVWVLSGDNATVRTSLLPRPESIEIHRATSALPSRVADNLFWFARYLERAEATVRVIRALTDRIAGSEPNDRSDSAALAEILFQWGATDEPSDDRGTLATALVGRDRPGSVASLMASAGQAGAVIRNRFPIDGWRALEAIIEILDGVSIDPAAAGDLEKPVNDILRNLAAITGVELDGMNRLSGWRFLKLGGRIERAILISRLVRRLALAIPSPECLDALLRIDGCQITYRVRYPHGAALKPVLDLVLFDDSNPRSLAFAISRIAEHVAALSQLHGRGGGTALSRPVRAVRDAFAALDLANLEAGNLIAIENLLMQLSDQVTARYFDLRGNPRHDGEDP